MEIMQQVSVILAVWLVVCSPLFYVVLKHSGTRPLTDDERAEYGCD